MKGIILAGGSGTRLYPLTVALSKQLVPVYDKPMIYYPLSVLITAGIREILIITTPEDKALFQKLLGDGSFLGCSITYATQANPNGLAEAFIIGESFIENDSVCLILGDNIFYGGRTNSLFQHNFTQGGLVYTYRVSNPSRYAVITLDKSGKPLRITEKPQNPETNLAVPGIYFFDNQVCDIAKEVKPSKRGELEITSVIETYLLMGKLEVIQLNKEVAWLDTGTFDSLSDASEFVRVIEKRQGTKIGCIEEEAYHQGFISKEQLQKLGQQLIKSGYGDYLLQIAKES